MTARQFSKLIEKTGLSHRQLAARLGCSQGTISNMRVGAVTVDPLIADYLAALVAAIESVPVPRYQSRAPLTQFGAEPES